MPWGGIHDPVTAPGPDYDDRDLVSNMLPLSSVLGLLLPSRLGVTVPPLLPVSVARPAVAATAAPRTNNTARAPRSPVREEGLGWAEAGWQQPGTVVFVRPGVRS